MRRIVAAVTLVLGLALVAVLTLRAFGVPIALGPEASATPPAATATPAASDGASPSLEDELAAIEAEVLTSATCPPQISARPSCWPETSSSGRPSNSTKTIRLMSRRPTTRCSTRWACWPRTRTTPICSPAALQPGPGLLRRRLQPDGGGDRSGPYRRGQGDLADEYTHALQDATFGIDALDLDVEGDDDGVFARLGLLEGDATTVMVLWAIEESLPAGDARDQPDAAPRYLGRAGVDGRRVRDTVPGQNRAHLSQMFATGGFSAVDEACGRSAP